MVERFIDYIEAFYQAKRASFSWILAPISRHRSINSNPVQMTTNANVPRFVQSIQDIGSKLKNRFELIELLRKAIMKYPSFSPEVSKAIKAAEQRSIEEFYELLMESVEKVNESIDECSPIEKFDVAVEFLGACLQIIMNYEKTVCRHELMELGLIGCINAVQIGLEEIVKLWGKRAKVELEIWKLEESFGNDDRDFCDFFVQLADLYWSKREEDDDCNAD